MIQGITPPILLSAFRKSPLYALRKQMTRDKNTVPSWNTITGGILAGQKMFFDKSGAWQQEMIIGIYDKELFDYVATLDLTGKTVLDIGAHIGYHTLSFAQAVGKEGRVFSFEPNPFNRERLLKNSAENKDISNRITVLGDAVSDKDGEETFVFGHKIENGSSSGSFLNRADTAWEKSVYEEKIGFKKTLVKTRSLDSMRSDGTVKNPPALIKIDVEGAEHFVLAGAMQTLATDRPMLLIEVHSIFAMWKVSEILHGQNYQFKLLKKETDGRCFFVMEPKELSLK